MVNSTKAPNFQDDVISDYPYQLSPNIGYIKEKSIHKETHEASEYGYVDINGGDQRYDHHLVIWIPIGENPQNFTVRDNGDIVPSYVQKSDHNVKTNRMYAGEEVTVFVMEESLHEDHVF